MVEGINYNVLTFMEHYPFISILLLVLYVGFFFMPLILRNFFNVKVLDYSMKVFSRVLYGTEYCDDAEDFAYKYVYRKHIVKSVIALLGILSAMVSIGFLILYLIIFGNFNSSLAIINLIKAGNMNSSQLTHLEKVISASSSLSAPINWFAVISQIFLVTVVLMDSLDTDSISKERKELSKEFKESNQILTSEHHNNKDNIS